jgi:hypothetical protein
MRRPEYSGFLPPTGERGALLPERGPGASGLGLLFIWLDADRRTAGCRARLMEVVGHCPVDRALIRWDEKAGLQRDAIRSQCTTRSRRKKETGNEKD